jgi:hypothetical protein
MYQIKTGMSTVQGDFQAWEGYYNGQDSSRSSLIPGGGHA